MRDCAHHPRCVGKVIHVYVGETHSCGHSFFLRKFEAFMQPISESPKAYDTVWTHDPQAKCLHTCQDRNLTSSQFSAESPFPKVHETLHIAKVLESCKKRKYIVYAEGPYCVHTVRRFRT